MTRYYQYKLQDQCPFIFPTRSKTGKTISLIFIVVETNYAYLSQENNQPFHNYKTTNKIYSTMVPSG